MRHQTEFRLDRTVLQSLGGLPAPLDCETNALLRLFLAPILETAPDWASLAEALGEKGYDLCFREGHLVILNDHGEAVVNDVGLAALTLLVAESDPANKDTMIRLIMNMLASPKDDS